MTWSGCRDRPVYYRAYRDPADRTAGYEYYRAFDTDIADNRAQAPAKPVTLPVLARGAAFSFGPGVAASYRQVGTTCGRSSYRTRATGFRRRIRSSSSTAPGCSSACRVRPPRLRRSPAAPPEPPPPEPLPATPGPSSDAPYPPRGAPGDGPPGSGQRVERGQVRRGQP
ncbi:hypothetical protein TPA0907_18280 [Micromonospora humidisoli]|nr:hypothetical protein TPA0907_18280 [Micromonospora sp. AKA109]